jgi:hypothetical protein
LSSFPPLPHWVVPLGDSTILFAFFC